MCYCSQPSSKLRCSPGKTRRRVRDCHLACIWGHSAAWDRTQAEAQQIVTHLTFSYLVLRAALAS